MSHILLMTHGSVQNMHQFVSMKVLQAKGLQAGTSPLNLTAIVHAEHRILLVLNKVTWAPGVVVLWPGAVFAGRQC
jgi:hypothetical protein